MAKTKDDFKMQRDAAHGISSSEPKVKEKRSMKYLDPKTDLTFKKIFYKHPDLLISLLNALLPLSDDEQIKSIKYLPTELVPQLYLHKNSIVDVFAWMPRAESFVWRCRWNGASRSCKEYSSMHPSCTLPRL